MFLAHAATSRRHCSWTGLRGSSHNGLQMRVQRTPVPTPLAFLIRPSPRHPCPLSDPLPGPVWFISHSLAGGSTGRSPDASSFAPLPSSPWVSVVAVLPCGLTVFDSKQLETGLGRQIETPAQRAAFHFQAPAIRPSSPSFRRQLNAQPRRGFAQPRTRHGVDRQVPRTRRRLACRLPDTSHLDPLSILRRETLQDRRVFVSSPSRSTASIHRPFASRKRPKLRSVDHPFYSCRQGPALQLPDRRSLLFLRFSARHETLPPAHLQKFRSNLCPISALIPRAHPIPRFLSQRAGFGDPR